MLKKIMLGLSALFFVSASFAEEIKVGEKIDVSQYRDISNFNISIQNEKIVNLVDDKDKLFGLKKVYLNPENRVIAIVASSTDNLKFKTLEACKRILNESHEKYQKSYNLIGKTENSMEWGYEYSKVLKDRDWFMVEFDKLTSNFAQNFLVLSEKKSQEKAKTDFIKNFNKTFSNSVDLKNLSCELEGTFYVIKNIDIGDMLEYFLLEIAEKSREHHDFVQQETQEKMILENTNVKINYLEA